MGAVLKDTGGIKQFGIWLEERVLAPGAETVRNVEKLEKKCKNTVQNTILDVKSRKCTL